VNYGRFMPPHASLSIYRGPVMHARMKPVTHRFTYDVFSTLIDLDRLDEVNCLSPILSVGRFNLLSFSPKDHGPRDGSDLRTYINRVLGDAGIDLSGGRVFLLCYPRVLGFTFNPLSVYYCYGANGQMAALVYEVRNTFGEAHTYVAPIAPGEAQANGVRQERDKLFYVSPFLDMSMRYHFRLQPPAEMLKLRILETDAQGPILAATFNGRHEVANTQSLLANFLRIPLLTFKIVAAIHWEALRLYIKGLRIRPRPVPPAPLSYRGPDTNAFPDARL
jgi:DUF1365 family protein